jgi:hypothetical protein
MARLPIFFTYLLATLPKFDWNIGEERVAMGFVFPLKS